MTEEIKQPMFGKCSLCGSIIDQRATGEPYLPFKQSSICYNCYVALIPEIYKMAGVGDGGIIHLAFKACLESKHNRLRRSQIKNYQKIFNELAHKYNFSCVYCGAKEDLSIDHIVPVSKGGTDDFSNLQILCMTCNRKKGNRWNG